jgi:opacity protein-like surface antigen
LLLAESYAAQGYVTEDQLYARTNLFIFSANTMYRYQRFKDITPFIGAGPALFIMNIKGTGYSGIIVDPLGFGVPVSAPRVNQTSVNIGLNLKAGVEYALTKDIGLGLEYHYNWAPIKVDNFRSISDAKGNFNSHTVGMFLAKHF